MSKDEAIKQLQGMVVGAEWLSDSMVQALSIAIEALSADIVEVVRCKDCKYRKKVLNCSYGECMYSACMVTDNDFCSNGEVKTNGQEQWDV